MVMVALRAIDAGLIFTGKYLQDVKKEGTSF